MRPNARKALAFFAGQSLLQKKGKAFPLRFRVLTCKPAQNVVYRASCLPTQRKGLFICFGQILPTFQHIAPKARQPNPPHTQRTRTIYHVFAQVQTPTLLQRRGETANTPTNRTWFHQVFAPTRLKSKPRPSARTWRNRQRTCQPHMVSPGLCPNAPKVQTRKLAH